MNVVSDEYVYKKEVDWSLLMEGLTLPDEYKEYLAIYTTEYDDSYVLEPILADDMQVLRNVLNGQHEKEIENILNFDIYDENAGFKQIEQLTKIRKLNKKIEDNLKCLYGYRCQICGKIIGEEYGSHIVEAHHIDYFVKSLNNDASNQIIVCPNHHSIIHDVNPVFDRNKLLYMYSNGYEEKIMLNYHL